MCRASTGSSPTAGASLPLSPPRLAIPGPSNMVYPSASTPTTPSYSPAPTTPSYSPRAATTAKKADSPSSPAPPSSPSYSPSPAPTTPSYSPRAATTAKKAYSPSSPSYSPSPAPAATQARGKTVYPTQPSPPSSPSYSPSPPPAATQARGKTVYPTQPAPVLDLTTNSTPSPPPVPVRRGPGRPRKEDPAVGPAVVFIASELGVEEGRPLRVIASRLQGEMFHFRVKWEGGEITWEPLDAAAAQYPHLVTAHLVRRGL